MAHVPVGVRQAVILSALLASMACGSSFTSSTPSPSLLEPSQPRSPTSAVSVSSTGVDPVVLHLDFPATVTFTNRDKVSRTLESAPELGWDDCPEMRTFGPLKPGEQRAVAFSEKDAVCAYHDASQPGNVAFQGYVAIH